MLPSVPHTSLKTLQHSQSLLSSLPLYSSQNIHCTLHHTNTSFSQLYRIQPTNGQPPQRTQQDAAHHASGRHGYPRHRLQLHEHHDDVLLPLPNRHCHPHGAARGNLQLRRNRARQHSTRCRRCTSNPPSPSKHALTPYPSPPSSHHPLRPLTPHPDFPRIPPNLHRRHHLRLLGRPDPRHHRRRLDRHHLRLLHLRRQRAHRARHGPGLRHGELVLRCGALSGVGGRVLVLGGRVVDDERGGEWGDGYVSHGWGWVLEVSLPSPPTTNPRGCEWGV